MSLVGTKFLVSDNSGAKEVKCIRLVNKTCFLGSSVLVSVKEIKNKEKVNRGDLKLAVIVELKKKQLRLDGNSFSNSRNAIVIINNNNVPLGTRILGLVSYELRKINHLKIISLGSTNTL